MTVCQIFFKLKFSKFIQNFRTLNVFGKFLLIVNVDNNWHFFILSKLLLNNPIDQIKCTYIYKLLLGTFWNTLSMWKCECVSLTTSIIWNSRTNISPGSLSKFNISLDATQQYAMCWLFHKKYTFLFNFRNKSDKLGKG